MYVDEDNNSEFSIHKLDRREAFLINMAARMLANHHTTDKFEKEQLILIAEALSVELYPVLNQTIDTTHQSMDNTDTNSCHLFTLRNKKY